jgi:hypothetical protein
MKGFLIFMVLLVGGSVYFLTHTEELANQALASIQKDEGPADQTFQDQFKDPAQFSLKYKPMLEHRALLVKILPFLGESALMLDVARDSQDRYDSSPLATDPTYGNLLMAYVNGLEDRGDQGGASMAFDICKQYVINNPDSPATVEFRTAMTRLNYKYPSFR